MSLRFYKRLRFRLLLTCATLVCGTLAFYLYDIKFLMTSWFRPYVISSRFRPFLVTNGNAPQAMFGVLQNISLEIFRNYQYTPGVPDDPRFQPINNHDAWVFSAFHDTLESQNLIRVYGIQRLELNDSIYCHILDKDSAIVLEGNRTLLYDWHGNRFRVVSYVCAIDPNDRPLSVSLTFNETDTPTNNVKIVYPRPMSRNFTVCYASLYNFANHLQIIQSIEFNKILGAQHFFVYNISISDNVDRVLRHYQNQGWLTVIQWRIPTTAIHYHGQILAINDCVYRNKGVSKYVVIQDTDEFIIPYQHSNWSDLIEKINADFDTINSTKRLTHKNVGTYTVETTFFQDVPNTAEWTTIKQNYSISEEEENFFRKYSLTSMTHFKRLSKTFGKDRQKSFVRPENVLFCDIHTTETHRPQAFNVRVNTSLALVHHYRVWSKNSPVILEALALRFKASLLRFVNNTLGELSVSEAGKIAV